MTRKTIDTQPPITRREAIIGAVSCAVLIARPASSAFALAAPDNAALLEEIQRFTGGTDVVMDERVTLELPDSAENGHTVPLRLVVESPMTDEDHVSEVLLLAEANPKPRIAALEFTPDCGRCAFQTRIRLAESQRVFALARMNSGSVYGASRGVKVTISGCAG
jgi:sulfur-oxidizing protein SoxY